MKNHGLLRVMAFSTEVEPGNIRACLLSAERAVDKAVAAEASVLLLQEMCLTSVSCGDLFLNGVFLDKADSAAKELTEYTAGKNLVVCFSLPVRKNGRIYSAAVLAVNGKIIGTVPLEPSMTADKSLSAFVTTDSGVIQLCGTEVPFGKDLLFEDEDNDLLSIHISSDAGKTPIGSASMILCPAAVLASVDSERTVSEVLRTRCALDDDAVIFCSAGNGESTSTGVYSGLSFIIEDGCILTKSEQFAGGEITADIDLEAIAYRKRRNGSCLPDLPYRKLDFKLIEDDHDSILRNIEKYPFISAEEPDRWRTAMEIQSRGLASRLKKTGIGKAVIGVSGGLDSTLALLVSVKAMKLLGRSEHDVIAVSMPCFGTSVRTKTNADRICEELGVDFRVIDISQSVKQHLKDIGHDGQSADTAYENAQARERTQVLMDIANMENGLVVGTGDMSEAALGWCTFNGDHMSMYNVNCSLTKTFIRETVRTYAEENGGKLAEVLLDIVNTPVSPELKPSVEGEISQKTEEIIGPYDAHDFFLYHFIRNGSGNDKILQFARKAFDGIYTEKQLKDWISIFFRRFFSSQFKRNCVPDGPDIGHITLSTMSGWTMPSDLSGEIFRE